MEFKVFKQISEVGEIHWDSLVSKRFFLSYKYLYAMEKACEQLEYRYVLATDKGQFVSLCYFQLIPFSGAALRNYLPPNAFFKWLFEYSLAKVKTKLLVLGNVIFTCENGVLIHDSYKRDAENLINSSLHAVLNSLDRTPLGTMISENIKTISSKLFCPKAFHIFKVEDRMELDIKGFATFDDYLNKLHSKYRLRVRKVNDLNKNTSIIDINKKNFNTYKEDLSKLFLNVLNNSKFKLTTISVDYFYQYLSYVDRFHFKGLMAEGKLVGFVSYFQLDSIIEVHYVGINYEYNESHRVYNFILILMIKIAVGLQIPKICFGRTAQELKSTLGAQPFSTLSSLKINYPLLNIFTPIFLSRMVPESWVQRSPFKHREK
jgi:hypothetical protein